MQICVEVVLQQIGKRCYNQLIVNKIGVNFKYSSSDCEIATTIILYDYKDSIDNQKVKNI